MLFKILREYFRRITRNYKIYAVSILGMSVAIIASFHIYHFVYKELSVDKFHEKREDIYRVIKKPINSNFLVAESPFPLGPLLKETLPQVNNYARFLNDYDRIIKIGENTIKDEVSYIDPSFFELFNFSLKQGRLEEFEETPNGIIISQNAALSLFGKQDAIGKTLTLLKDYSSETKDVVVIGILNDIPETSTIKSNFLININSYKTNVTEEMKWVTVGAPVLFIHIPKVDDLNFISSKAGELTFVNMKKGFKIGLGEDMDKPYYQFELQPLNDVYMHSENVTRQKIKGDFQFLKIIVLVGLLMLFLAISNYIIMNLGLNMNRAEEFNMRRYLGISKAGVCIQLIMESLINTFICFALTFLTYPILGKFISYILGFNYHLSFTDDLIFIASYFLIIVFLGIAIGGLEFLFSYNSIFKSKANNHGSANSKKILIGFQLFIFIGLIICILFVRKQVDYIQERDLGFSVNNVVHISTRNDKELKPFLETKSYVKSTSYSQLLYTPSFGTAPLINTKTQQVTDVILHRGDQNFLKTNNVKLLYGKNLSNQASYNTSQINDEQNGSLTEVLVSETFVRKANLKEPIGQVFNLENYKFVIIGVVNDVQNIPLYYPIQPLVVMNIDYNGWYYGSLVVSYQDGYRKQLESDIRAFFTEKGIDSAFLDEVVFQYDLNDIYKKELQLKRLLEAFTVIVLFISLLGLVAISLFITESKTKEIGIRKVNGATINEIMLMLNKDFIKWVAIAFVIACPIAYYAMHKWLENFAYKTELSWWVFALAGLFTLLIALLTVSWQTYRAATSNPVESLRDE
ncbi:ABC transporter permease [Snuella sedimenti]|uniref:ABC transporter permease n=1 Tax=Snuella sedimenti TaxID=2798802 RepID=A0A8J7IHL0_9FLAO|nr:ABC transporter permease [Snuella sedimenti]MBJ6368553.1 ABC transporter permease [Snuella sedimenti]